MKALLISAALACALSMPAAAGTVYSGRQMESTSPCNPATFVGKDGRRYVRAENCRREFSQFSSIAVPIDGNFNRAMRARATRFRELPGGRIQLY